MSQSIKNPDGTVNLEGIDRHVEHLKGKYAQNAKNYEQNTGKPMSFGGAKTQADQEGNGDQSNRKVPLRNSKEKDHE